MNKKLLKILNMPYPASNSKMEILISSFFIAGSLFVFLVIFQPFGTYNFSSPFKYILLTPYSLIAFLIFTATNSLLIGRTPKWNMQKELIKIIAILSICSLFNYFYNTQFINHTEFAIRSFLYMFLYTLAVGTPLCLIYFLGRYIYLKSEKQPHFYQEALPPFAPSKNNLIVIQSDMGEVLELCEKDFLFAKSEGNYCNVHYLNNSILNKQLIRLSLKKLEHQIGGEKIIRCHRSFLINLNKIVSAKGNAQGYKLGVEEADTIIPVSRKYVEIMRSFINLLCHS